MAQRFRPLTQDEFCYPGIIALIFESEDSASNEKKKYHLSAFRGEETLCWLTLEMKESDVLKLRNVFVQCDDECLYIQMKLINFAEKWAIERGFKKLLLMASDYCAGHYERLAFKPAGNAVREEGMILLPMIKTL